jgi:protein SCO1
MGKAQRIITITLWSVLIAAMVGMVLGKLLMPRPSNAPAVLYPGAEFTLTDQDNKPFSSKDLRGRPYVAAFIFTTCGDVCPRMTARMVELQPKLPPAVQLVSFSVNPEHDTPAVLKQYAKDWKADESRWHFLTGPTDRIYDAAAGMKIAAKPAEGTNPIIHSERLILVDADGNVRGTYLSTDDESVKKLLADAQAVAKEAKGSKAAPAGGAR